MLRRFAISGLMAFLALAAGARTRPQYGGTLRVEIEGDPWEMPDGLARRLVLDTLTTEDEAGGARPRLATQWEAQNEGRRWEFAIREGVRFQDGSPLTAEAVAASLEQSCATAGVVCPWNAVHAVGAAVIFTTDASMPDLPEILAQTQFAIARQDAAGTVEGTGPFRVAGFANGALNLAANDDCREGRPFVDGIAIFPHRAIRDQWLDLSVGRADVVEVPAEMLRQAEQQHLDVLVSGPMDLLALTIAPQGPLAGVAMRQAIAAAVDRAALHNVIFQKQGEISASLLPEEISGYGFLFPADRDVDRARVLRGGANPAPLALSVVEGDAAMQLAAQRLALNLHEAGFNVQVAASTQAALLRLRREPLESTDPRAALDEVLADFGQNEHVTGTDFAALWQAERAAMEQSTIVPLLWLPRGWAAGERVRDLRLAPDGMPLLADASLETAQ
jgi:peptide/nickel transport system substrate-binding protein